VLVDFSNDKGRVSFLIGNGLGRAVYPDKFTLSSAIESAFSKLDIKEQEVLNKFFTLKEGNPESEEDLVNMNTLYRMCSHWKGSNQEFIKPLMLDCIKAYKKMLFNIARYFNFDFINLNDPFGFGSSDILTKFRDFKYNLLTYIAVGKSNMFTINYDNIIYNPHSAG
jgi:hypothetical protein